MAEPKNELQRNAQVEARRKELDTFQRALDVQWLNSRMDDAKMSRCLAMIRREAEMEKDFQERTDHAAIVNAKAEKETAMAKEIVKIRQEEDCKLLRRHYLRERDPSLRELMTKLQAGYVCRDQKQQILHNEYKKLQDKIEDQRANSILLKALYNNQEQAEKEDREGMAFKAQYCKELQEQLVNRQKVRQCQYEESLIEKKMLDDIIRTIYDEDMKELQQRREEREQLRHEMEASYQAREGWRQKQREQLVLEERAIEAQVKAAGDRSTAILEERDRKNRLREELNERIANEIMAAEAARQEKSNLIKLLQEQEVLEKNCQDDIAEREKTERVKRETKEALTEQMQSRIKEAERQKEREAKFRDVCAAKVKEDDDKEKQKEEKVKLRRKKYAEELKMQIQDNRVRRSQEHKLENARAQYVWDYDKAWRGEVSNERKNLIEEHVPHLLGCLQAGVVKKPDIPAIQSGLKQHPKLQDIDLSPLTSAKARTLHPKCNAQCRILREY